MAFSIQISKIKTFLIDPRNVLKILVNLSLIKKPVYPVVTSSPREGVYIFSDFFFVICCFFQFFLFNLKGKARNIRTQLP